MPSWLLMVVAVLAYGPWWGTLIATGAVAASSLGYGFGNLVGENGLNRIKSEKTLKNIERETERYGIWAIIVTRINPLPSNGAISLVALIMKVGIDRRKA